MERKTRIAKPIETILKRITKISCESPKLEFVGLIQHFNKENLIGCFHELDGKKASAYCLNWARWVGTGGGAGDGIIYHPLKESEGHPYLKRGGGVSMQLQ